MLGGQTKLTDKGSRRTREGSHILVMSRLVLWDKLFPGTFPVCYYLRIVVAPSINSDWYLAVVMLAWKLGPALATGNAIVLKPSEASEASDLQNSPL